MVGCCNVISSQIFQIDSMVIRDFHRTGKITQFDSLKINTGQNWSTDQKVLSAVVTEIKNKIRNDSVMFSFHPRDSFFVPRSFIKNSDSHSIYCPKNSTYSASGWHGTSLLNISQAFSWCLTLPLFFFFSNEKKVTRGHFVYNLAVDMLSSSVRWKSTEI